MVLAGPEALAELEALVVLAALEAWAVLEEPAVVTGGSITRTSRRCSVWRPGYGRPVWWLGSRRFAGQSSGRCEEPDRTPGR